MIRRLYLLIIISFPVFAQTSRYVEVRQVGNEFRFNDGRVFTITGKCYPGATDCFNIRGNDGKSYKYQRGQITSSDGSSVKINGNSTTSSDGTFCKWNGSRQTCWDNKDTRPNEDDIDSLSDCKKIKDYYSKEKSKLIARTGTAESGAYQQLIINESQDMAKCTSQVYQQDEERRRRIKELQDSNSSKVNPGVIPKIQTQPQPAAPPSDLKNFCLANTQPINCEQGLTYFKCFELRNQLVAVFKDSQTCYLTTCDCFNFYKEN